MGPLLILFIVQACVAGIVIFILRQLLDKELIKAALEKFEHVKMSEGLNRIIVRSAKDLKDPFKHQLESIYARKFKNVPLDFQHDPSIQGGLVIVIGNEEIDCSMAGRLRNFWA